MTEKPFVCKYCNHGFLYEKTFLVHVCEPKRRALAKTEKHVIIAYDAYRRFFKLAQKHTKEKTYEEFSTSPYYTAFIKFGSYVSNIKPLYQDHYIDYMIKSGIRIDYWCKDENYDKYVVDLIRKESIDTALERSIANMIEWADNNNSQWNRYFLDVSQLRATFDIKDGKISPWLVLNCQSGTNLLKSLDDQQLNMIETAIDPTYWLLRFKRRPDDLKLVKDLIQSSNL